MAALVLPLLLSLAGAAVTQPALSLPPRAPDALGGRAFAAKISDLNLAAREKEVLDQVMAGNVPEFLRHLQPITLSQTGDGRTDSATVWVTPDYLAVGSEEDYFLAPMTPSTAQPIAAALDCSLPTRKIVDAIYHAAEVRLFPSPIPPSPQMTSVAVFVEHNETVRRQRKGQKSPAGALTAGHKKDVVISPRLATAPSKVAIYGWHTAEGCPIQPLYLGHTVDWVDYSQCIRLVRQDMIVNGRTNRFERVLADPVLAGLVSDEGPFAPTGYSLREQTSSAFPPRSSSAFATFTNTPASAQSRFAEQVIDYTLESGVRIRINTPAEETKPGQKITLIYYALPNGNTIEQTAGRKLRPGDDWHFDIQHIAAQTRFIRRACTNNIVGVAYLENSLKSWPAWRKKNGDALLPSILASVKTNLARVVSGPLESDRVDIVLSGHSGGGSLIFGYLNALNEIPDDVKRIVFLDSNYAYNRDAGHKAKLADWLRRADQHFLMVLAYNDAVALLDGKPFVSASGGTWGRSHAMQKDLAEDFAFTLQQDAEFQNFQALDGRVRFILKENPQRKIYHTVQVERNGFIHSLLFGTSRENCGYAYFGSRAYLEFLDD